MIELQSGGWDISPDMIVSGGNVTPPSLLGTVGPVDGLLLSRPDGTSTVVRPQGLFSVNRPSLSPDGRFAVVQATEQARPERGFATVYVIDLATGAWR